MKWYVGRQQIPLTLANCLDIFALCLCCISNVEQCMLSSGDRKFMLPLQISQSIKIFKSHCSSSGCIMEIRIFSC